MSDTAQARPIAGSIVFDFDNLFIQRESGPQRRAGRATYAYDGRGGYWPIALVLDAMAFGAPSKAVTHGCGLWRETFRRLERYHVDDIKAAIDEDLTRQGGHMAIFDEHLPPPAAQRLAPPHVPGGVRAAALVLDAGAACLELGALMALVVAIMLGCLAAEVTHPMPHHGPARAVAAAFATLEAGDGR